MKVTKVCYYDGNLCNKALTVCDVVLDGELKIKGVRLYKNNKKGYYLVFPSSQDIYQEIEYYNPEFTLQDNNEGEAKKYDEFFFPIKSSFYEKLLSTITEGYKKRKEDKGCKVYVPK